LVNTTNNVVDESSIIAKGKRKMDDTNEDSDSSSSWEEEKLPFASHFHIFPRDPLLFSEGASKVYYFNFILIYQLRKIIVIVIGMIKYQTHLKSYRWTLAM
jgi:hypothetical protein